MSETLDQRFAGAAARHPRATALEWLDPETGVASIDYGALHRAVDQAVPWLAARGVCPGDRVALLLPKGLAFVVVHLACLRQGAVSVPLNPRSSRRELQHILEDSRPALLVTSAELADMVNPGALATIVRVDPHGAQEYDGDAAGDSAAGSDGVAPQDSSQLACLIYTSGTTGRPKGVMLSHRALAANDNALRRAWEWSAEDRLLHVLPLFHVHGLFVALHGALGSGASCRLLPRFDPSETWQQLDRFAATVFMGVPTMYHRLIAQAPRPAPELPMMRLFTCGSAALRAETLVAFEQLTGQRILERYGMSEVGMACSNPYRGERRAGTVGFDLPGVSTRLADTSDPARERAAPRGSVGEVMIHSDALFSGYWNQPETTSQAFPAGAGTKPWLASGDLGRRDGDGYLHLVGRAKELIISGGFNIHPQEVEDCLGGCAGVSEAAAFGIPDDDLGEIVMAAVVPLPGEPLDGDALIQACRQELAHYKAPRAVLFLDELPRNAMGKLRRGDLPAACGLTTT